MQNPNPHGVYIPVEKTENKENKLIYIFREESEWIWVMVILDRTDENIPLWGHIIWGEKYWVFNILHY